MAMSTVQVVLLPIVIGVTLNKFVPKVCRAVEAGVPHHWRRGDHHPGGRLRRDLRGAHPQRRVKLQLAAFLLHAVGGAAGYWVMRLFGYDETVCRTTAIETSMKSSAFGFLLATLHFPEFLVRVPSAVSVVWDGGHGFEHGPSSGG